jgi:hypothetical protein
MNFIVNEKGFWSEDNEEVLESIKKGFLECHNAMWKDLGKIRHCYCFGSR